MILRKRNTAALLLLSVLLKTAAATAGNSSSGGGDVYGDSLNPWFLENTTSVSYCIEMDGAHFHLPVDQAKPIIESAIQRWKTEFQSAQKNWYTAGELGPYGQVRIATQAFNREQCSASTMLRFQLGVLSTDQRKSYIPDPTGVIAQTVRTSYDRENLRGRGFIYVAADSGPLRPRGLKMATSPWTFQDGAVFQRVLLHELGHMFGLSHSGRAYDLMGQAHPEFIVLKSTLDDLAKSRPDEVATTLNRIGIFGFEFPNEQESCDGDGPIDIGGNDAINSFFGVPQGWKCRKFKFTANSVNVFAASAKGQPYQLIGATSATTPMDYSAALLRIKLSRSQQVFQKVPSQALQSGYLDGPAAMSRRVLTTVYTTSNGRKSGTIKASFLPGQYLEMDAITGDQVIPVFVYGG